MGRLEGNVSRDLWERRYRTFIETGFGAPARKDSPSIFASETVKYLAGSGRLLDLGAGAGRDSRFFAGQGYEVVSTDVSHSALKLSRERTLDLLRCRVMFVPLDMSKGFPFQADSFETVYAHLSLHYFDSSTTATIISECRRALKSGGVFAFLANSTHDPECGTGEEIEKDYFLIKEDEDEGPKRYFSVESTKQFVNAFETVILDDKGEADFKAVRGVHNLIRFIGRKR